MARPDRERLAAGERLLATWNVAATAAGELGAALGRDADADLAIVHRLGTVQDPAAVALLQQIEKTAASKDLRREARRSLYRLEQRGMEIPRKPAPPAAPLVGAPALQGLVSAIDGRGDQLVWLLKPRGEGLYHFFAMINDPEGMRETELNVITRKGLRELRAELKAGHEIEFVEADALYCDFLMHRAFRWARERGGHTHGDYLGFRARLLRQPAPENLPPLALASLDAEGIRADESLVADSSKLLEEKEFRTWFFPRQRLQPYLDAVAEAESSPLVLPEEHKKERVEAVVRRAVGELFAGEQGRSFARRLLEMAYFLLATQRGEAAKLAVAAAFALERGEGGTGIGFCEQLVGSSLGFWYAMEKQEEEERRKESFLVTPQEFATGQHRKR